ncbi:hypothetical protein [Nocardia sp. NBC_01009]|uniref:hypothetical protein n=1 Tax=Nocardia sp. NBC_01009 TaxID=2975996 RepID=UPI00386E9C68|nr:hypothetical protein OHA42_13240 [Nocardia sp. NBC_01009]
MVRGLSRIADPALTMTAIESCYGRALLMTHRPLRPADTLLANRAFGEFLDWATQGSVGGLRRGEVAVVCG